MHVCGISLVLYPQPTPAVRAAAFTLFGTLSRFGRGPAEGPFFEQIQTNFVSLLLHLNEGDPVVVVVCLVHAPAVLSLCFMLYDCMIL